LRIENAERFEAGIILKVQDNVWWIRLFRVENGSK